MCHSIIDQQIRLIAINETKIIFDKPEDGEDSLNNRQDQKNKSSKSRDKRPRRTKVSVLETSPFHVPTTLVIGVECVRLTPG